MAVRRDVDLRAYLSEQARPRQTARALSVGLHEHLLRSGVPLDAYTTVGGYDARADTWYVGRVPAPLRKAAALPAGRRWITVHPNGDDEKGIPVLIEENPTSPGVFSIVAGAGGKLNHMQLTGIKSVKEYREQSELRRKDKEAKKQEERAKKIAAGEVPNEEEFMDTKTAKRQAERGFINQVAQMAGWDLSPLEAWDKPEEMAQRLGIDVGAAKIDAFRAHQSYLSAARKTAADIKNRLLNDSEARQEAGLDNNIPIHVQPVDAEEAKARETLLTSEEQSVDQAKSEARAKATTLDAEENERTARMEEDRRTADIMREAETQAKQQAQTAADPTAKQAAEQKLEQVANLREQAEARVEQHQRHLETIQQERATVEQHQETLKDASADLEDQRKQMEQMRTRGEQVGVSDLVKETVGRGSGYAKDVKGRAKETVASERGTALGKLAEDAAGIIEHAASWEVGEDMKGWYGPNANAILAHLKSAKAALAAGDEDQLASSIVAAKKQMLKLETRVNYQRTKEKPEASLYASLAMEEKMAGLQAQARAAKETAKEEGVPVKAEVDPKIKDMHAAKQILLAEKAMRQKLRGIDRERDPFDMVERKWMDAQAVDMKELERAVTDDLQTQLQADLNSSFMHEVAHSEQIGAASGFTPEEQQQALQRHIGVGAFAAIDTLSQVAAGQSLVSRDVLDTFGQGAAVQLMARKLSQTLSKDDLNDVISGLEQHHAERNDEDVTDAMEQARASYETINDLQDGDLEHPDDIMLAQQNNELRKQAIRDAQTALGTAWGTLTTEAALIWQLKNARSGKDTGSFTAHFSDELDPASMIRQVKALGLEEGDYKLTREGGNQYVTVLPHAVDKLYAAPVDKEERALRQHISAIRAGAEDEIGWLPAGIKSRPATTFTAPDAVLARYGRPFNPAAFGGMFPDPEAARTELEDYVGSRLADGEHWGDVSNDIVSASFLAEHGLSDDPAYLDMAHNLFQWQDSAFQAEHTAKGKQQTYAAAKKALVKENERRAQEYAARHLDKYRQTTGDETAQAVNTQSIGEPSEGIVDAIHRTVAANPLLRPAFQDKPLSSDDSEAVRQYYYKHILGQDPPKAEPKAITDAENADELTVPDSVNHGAAEEAQMGGLFGAEPEAPPDQAAQPGAAPAGAGVAGADAAGMVEIRNAKGQVIGQVHQSEISGATEGRIDRGSAGIHSLTEPAGAGRSPWAEYVFAHGDVTRAQQTILAHMRGEAAKEFSRHYGMVTGQPLRVGQATLPHTDIHAMAARDPSRLAQRIREMDQAAKAGQARIATRDKAGRFLHGARREIAKDLAESAKAGSHRLFGATEGRTAEDEALTMRPTIGERAENELKALWTETASRFDPHQPVQINRETRMDGQTITQQRYIKAIEAGKRMGVFAGVGSGKSLISIGAFTDLHSKGQVKRALFQVPSAVQAQFGGEMLKYTEPGKYNWFAHPGASFEQRMAAYKDPGRHMVVVTHQSFRDDMMRLYAREHGMSLADASTHFDGLDEGARAKAMRGVMDKHGIHFDMHVADEAHEALNRQGKANSNLANVHDAMAANSPYYMGLTGTPVKNDASEAFDWLHKLAPEQYGDRAEFMRRYGPNTSATKEALQREVSRHFYASRVPLSVQANHQTRQVDLTPEQQAAYNGVIADVGKVRAARSRGTADVETLKKLSPESFRGAPPEQHPAIADALSKSIGMIREGALARVVNGHPHEQNAKIQAMVKDAVAQKAKGQPGIVFSHNRGPVKQIEKAMRAQGLRTLTISGSDSAAIKAQKKAQYIRGEADVLIGTDAIESGMDLSAAKWVGHLDIPDTYKRYEQRTARAHRLGQDRDVDVYDYVSNTQHDAVRARRLRRKQGLAGVFQSPAEGLDDTGLALQIAKMRAQRIGHASVGDHPTGEPGPPLAPDKRPDVITHEHDGTPTVDHGALMHGPPAATATPPTQQPAAGEEPASEEPAELSGAEQMRASGAAGLFG